MKSCAVSRREIGEVNKGRKMLEKMGWKKGEGLGKDGAGMKAPVRSAVVHLCFSVLGCLMLDKDIPYKLLKNLPF